MVRQIIHIDEEKCNGCGLCATACHEGAIDIVDGKAKLMRENFCDGFGDCLPGCPTGAITFEQREAPEYDEAVAKAKNFWLNKHLPSVKFDEIHIVPYGTPKSTVAKEKNGYLFDDEENNRAEWGINAFDVVNMLDILGELE